MCLKVPSEAARSQPPSLQQHARLSLFTCALFTWTAKPSTEARPWLERLVIGL